MDLTPFIKKRGEVHYNTKVRIYPDGTRKITVCSKPIFRDENYLPIVDEPLKVPVSKPKDMTNDVRDDSVRRAKNKVFDIALCNDFDYFITWTLDKEKIDRYNPEIISKKLQQFLKDRVKRNDARYLVIPEHHKDGAIHMHGLLSGDFDMIPFTSLPDGRIVYNMPQWSYGFSTAIQLDDQRQRVSAYMTKYVTKEFKKIFGNFYYAGGHGLVRSPEIVLCDTDYYEINSQEYGPKDIRIAFKYLEEVA
jgi:hypothetical protein|nr:MAG TPA: protein of unknown function DUF1424 [Inoviridae sp.]